MRILFLDIDQVLTGRRWAERRFLETGGGHGPDDLDPVCCRLLGQSLKATGAVIVVTSTWRLNRSLGHIERVLEDHGATHVNIVGAIGAQRCQNPGGRAKGIVEWRTMVAAALESYAVVDDEPDAIDGSDPARMVRTTHEHGLTQSCASHLVKILRTPIAKAK